jgi:hypothetical protein
MYRNSEESQCNMRANRPAAMAQEQSAAQAIALDLPRPQFLSLIASPSLFIIISLLLISLALILLGL